MEKFVLIADPIDDVCSQTLQEKYGLTVVYHPDIDLTYIKHSIDRYDGLIVRSRTNVDKQMIELGAKGATDNFQKGNLKVIGRAGMGLDNIDLKAAELFDVKVLNVIDGHIPSVAEHTIGLMIALSRDLVSASNSTRDGNWEKSKFKGNELYGKSLGIIGYGQIGQQVAAIAKAIGMEILIHDPYVQKSSSFDNQLNYDEMEFVSLKLMFKECDFITLHVPLNSETEKM
ncbi:phosphoglycerate dehydrogenase, partial [candidate division KSB1 bacterium]|nr:phosphoglycerate dehydrogenase [candidate division KSB1 bacterium]